MTATVKKIFKAPFARQKAWLCARWIGGYVVQINCMKHGYVDPEQFGKDPKDHYTHAVVWWDDIEEWR